MTEIIISKMKSGITGEKIEKRKFCPTQPSNSSPQHTLPSWRERARVTTAAATAQHKQHQPIVDGVDGGVWV